MKRKRKGLAIPKGLTEAQVIEAIDYVAKFLAAKYTFAQYGVEDLIQESHIFAYEALERFDPNFKPGNDIYEKLKSFLFTHIRNRLFNLKRNKLKRCTASHNLNYPLNLDYINDQGESSTWYDARIHSNVCMDEVRNLIDLHLESDLRPSYKKMVADIPVPYDEWQAIQSRIIQIVGSGYYAQK